MTVALLTQHGKERVIAPVFEELLGARVERVEGFDTDALGTFTREVPRAGTQIEAARAKARIAIERTGLSCGLGSEGSFGPHPVGWFPYNVERIVFVDAARGVEVVGAAEGPAVHAHEEVSRWDALVAFAARAGFPGHGLVLSAGGAREKGLRDFDALRRAFDRLQRRSEAVFAESDLRADQHPLRMQRIGEAARDLAERLACACPRCASPGFGRAERIAGRPCSACGLPTAAADAERWACVRCGWDEVRPLDGEGADPSRCPLCNP